MQTYPQVKLRIVSGFSGHGQDWLIRGKADLGLADEGQKSANLSANPIIIEQLFLIQPAGLTDSRDGVPINAKEALSLPLILPNPEHGLRGRIEAIAQDRMIDLNVVLEIDILPPCCRSSNGASAARSCLWSASSTMSARAASSRPSCAARSTASWF